MSSARKWSSALGMVLWLGCGGSVDVQTGSGAAGGAGGAGGGVGGGAGSAPTSTTTVTPSATTSSETTSTTVPVEEGCPGLPADTFWVDVQVAGTSYHLTSDCPYYGEPYGPAAYAWTNGKSGPQWYFTIHACEAVIPEGSMEGPSISVVAGVPDGAEVAVPYATTGDIVHITKEQDELAPATSPKIVFETFGEPHGLVTGTFAGMVVLPSGETAAVEGQFSVCRRDDVIYI